MGYYSDVALVLTKAGVKTFKGSLAKQDDDLRERIADFMTTSDDHYFHPESHFVEKNTGAEMWYWDHVKWYTDFTEVNFIESTISKMDESDYYFLRIGESEDDTEVLGCFWDNPFDVYLTRGIEIGWSES